MSENLQNVLVLLGLAGVGVLAAVAILVLSLANKIVKQSNNLHR